MDSDQTLFVPRDIFLGPITLASLIGGSALMGDLLATFFWTALGILIIALVYSIIRRRSFDRQLAIDIKERFYVLTFAGLVTLIWVILLPYIIFGDSFVSVYVVNTIYGVPVVFVLFISLYIITKVIRGSTLDFKQIALRSLAITTITLIIGSIATFVVIDRIYRSQIEKYEGRYIDTLTELQTETQGKYVPGLSIFDEIETYQEGLVLEWNRKLEEIQQSTQKPLFCLRNDCVRLLVDRAYHLIEFAVDSMIINRGLTEANEKWVEIREFENEALELEVLTLEDEIESYYAQGIQYPVPPDEDTEEWLALIETEFSYGDIEGIVEEMASESTTLLSDLYAPEDASPLQKSNSYLVLHTKPSKELLRLVVKISYFTRDFFERSDDLTAQIFENDGIDEPIESRIIRLELIRKHLEILETKKEK